MSNESTGNTSIVNKLILTAMVAAALSPLIVTFPYVGIPALIAICKAILTRKDQITAGVDAGVTQGTTHAIIEWIKNNLDWGDFF